MSVARQCGDAFGTDELCVAMRGLAQPVIRTKRELNDLFGMGGTRYFRWCDIEGWRNGIILVLPRARAG